MLFSVDPATAILLYLFILLSIPLIIWAISSLNKKKTDTTPTFIITCPTCHATYPADREEKITQCPTCHSYS